MTVPLVIWYHSRNAAHTPHERTLLDRLVYDLYGLTEDEIRLVEDGGD